MANWGDVSSQQNKRVGLVADPDEVDAGGDNLGGPGEDWGMGKGP